MLQVQKWRLPVGIGGIFALLIMANLALFHSYVQSKAAAKWVEHTYQVLLGLEAVTAKIHEHKHSYQQGSTHSPHQPLHQNKNLVAIPDAMRHELYAEIEKIKRLTATDAPQQQQRLTELEPILVTRFALSDRLDKIRHEQGVDSNQALAIGDQIDQLNAQINQKMDQIGEAEKQILAERQQVAAMKESIAIISFSSAWLVALVILGITAKALRTQIIRRKQHEIALLNAKNHAEDTLRLLQQTQGELIQSEKMAALGGLVAGIAHEINTPIGITLASATYLNAETTKAAQCYQDQELSGDELESYFDTATQSSTLMTINCQRAADLINSFKQVAVDQTSDEAREFDLKNYLSEVLLSLHPQIKKTAVKVRLDCPELLRIKSYPGAISQILTNFIINSLLHGYEAEQSGQILIRVKVAASNEVELIYSDDGKGIAPELHAKIFEPFFTTRRGQGGSGLGLHIIYNLVRQTLKGHIQMCSALGQGTTFKLRFQGLVT